jgi:two-component system chemotaxis response regulator CheY
MAKQVLSVGQCGPDHGTLVSFIRSHFDAEVTPACLACDTLEKLHSKKFDLVLINRKLDADYSDGMDILRAVKREPALADVPVMIITNYPEHQTAALKEGALYGFGKLEYDRPETLERLRQVLG